MHTRLHSKRRLKPAAALTGLRKGAFGALLACAALGVSAIPAAANNTLSVGAGGTSIYVNGTNISTSSIDLEELAQLQGVPASTVKLELEGAAVESPERAAIDRLVSSLSADTPLSTALEEVSLASGGTLTPITLLTRVIADNGQPGAPGASGASGSNGAAGPGSGQQVAGATTKKCGDLRLASRRVAGRASSKVRVRFTLPCAAKVSYSGRRLAKGSRQLKAGKDVLVLKLPRRPGKYVLTLTAANASGKSKGQITLIDSKARVTHKARR